MKPACEFSLPGANPLLMAFPKFCITDKIEAGSPARDYSYVCMMQRGGVNKCQE